MEERWRSDIRWRIGEGLGGRCDAELLTLNLKLVDTRSTTGLELFLHVLSELEKQ